MLPVNPKAMNLVNPKLAPADPCLIQPTTNYLVPVKIIGLNEDLGQFYDNVIRTPSSDDNDIRSTVIKMLSEIVMMYASRIGYKHTENGFGARILPFGSYGLGVHSPDSDMDLLCIGPFLASSTNFFEYMKPLLAKTSGVSNLYHVESVNLPMLKFKLYGISIDLVYAQPKENTLLKDVDILTSRFLAAFDVRNGKRTFGVRANLYILQNVPEVEIFRSFLRFIKEWAKRRGVYGNLFGYFGGIHLAVLAAYICQHNPNASLTNLISNFFFTFASWEWPYPVVLRGCKRPLVDPEKNIIMPIHLPSSQNEYCRSNITTFTARKISEEFCRGRYYTESNSNIKWKGLFKPYNYSKKYSRFLRICIMDNKEDLEELVGFVKSRFKTLIDSLTKKLGFCDPNPIKYTNEGLLEPHVVFFWGLNPTNNDHFDLQEEWGRHFKKFRGGRRVTVDIVEASRFPQKSEHGTTTNGDMIPFYCSYDPLYYMGDLAPN